MVQECHIEEGNEVHNGSGMLHKPVLRRCRHRICRRPIVDPQPFPSPRMTHPREKKSSGIRSLLGAHLRDNKHHGQSHPPHSAGTLTKLAGEEVPTDAAAVFFERVFTQVQTRTTATALSHTRHPHHLVRKTHVRGAPAQLSEGFRVLEREGKPPPDVKWEDGEARRHEKEAGPAHQRCGELCLTALRHLHALRHYRMP